MTFPERNACLADAWSSLTTEERDYFNSRAKTEKVIPTKEQIKRTLKRISNEVMKTNLFSSLTALRRRPRTTEWIPSDNVP